MSVTEMPFTRMTEAEWRMRVDLAACHRLVDRVDPSYKAIGLGAEEFCVSPTSD